MLFCYSISFAQQNKKFSYLVVTFNSWKDHNNDRRYFTIKPESKEVSGMYKLSTYIPGSEKDNTSAFFFSRTDSTQSIYNYFRSINEALLFLGENGWELVSVNNNISSESRTRWLDKKDHIYTDVKSEPVYYFKKTVDNF